MHELSVCQSLLRQVADVARQNDARAVEKIVLQIGPLAGVEPRLLKDAFPIAVAGSIAEQAELEIENLPLMVRCLSCGAESEVQPSKLVCASCGDWQTQLISGDEMLLASVEMIK